MEDYTTGSLLQNPDADTQSSYQTSGSASNDGDYSTAGDASGGNSGASDAPLDLNIPDDFKGLEKEIGEYKSIAKEIGLNQKQAQRLLDHNHASFKNQLQAKQDQSTSWLENIKADNTMGGSNFDATVMNANAGLKNFDKEGKIYGLLQESGYANHPEVIRFLSKIGQAHSEDTYVKGSYNPNLSLEERMYPNWKIK